MKRVKLLWLLPVLAAMALGIVFLRCMGDVDEAEEPLQWRNAWAIPVNYRMSVDTVFYNEVFNVVNQGIAEAVPGLPPEAQEEFTTIILQSNDFIREIISDEFVGSLLDTLLRFIDNDPAVQELILENNLSTEQVKEVATAVAQEVQTFKDEIIKDIFGEFYLSLGTEYIPALGGLEFLRKIRDPKVNYTFDLINETPLELTLYVLFFEEQHYRTVFYMSDASFVEFVKGGGYKEHSGYFNFFDDKEKDERGLIIKSKNFNKAPKMSDEMNETLCGFIVGTKALAWRWMAVIKGDPGEILGALGEKQEYYIDARLSLEIQGTNNLDSLIRW